jgi:hypothetical protein
VSVAFGVVAPAIPQFAREFGVGQDGPQRLSSDGFRLHAALGDRTRPPGGPPGGCRPFGERVVLGQCIGIVVGE